ncbi:MAG: riboflavin biosynthesis protein RibF [Gemmatimonadaceae bacterium]
MPDSILPSALPPDVAWTAVTVGTFDGVHRGHQFLLDALAQAARARELKSLLVTFEPHPLEIVNPTAAPLLLTVGDEKLEVISESGIDYLAIVPFTRGLANMAAEDFVREVLCRRFRMQYLMMGHDHGFGRNRSGNAATMHTLGGELGFEVDVRPPIGVGDGPPVSSTGIRRAIAGGDLERARVALGRSYSVSGRVIAGEQRGAALGFRTINVPLPSHRKLLPPFGVYAVRVQTPHGAFGGMLNLGPRPTFGDDRPLLEAHLFDVAIDLYGAPVRIDFVRRMRDTQRFANADALRAQLQFDADSARAILRDDRPANSVATKPIAATS